MWMLINSDCLYPKTKKNSNDRWKPKKKQSPISCTSLQKKLQSFSLKQRNIAQSLTTLIKIKQKMTEGFNDLIEICYKKTNWLF